MKIKEEQFYFDSNDHKLYGMYYEPVSAIRNCENYLILHPFAEEKKSSQKVLIDLACRLCEKGNNILLFDYYGCGDSEGELSEATLSIWLDDIKQAALVLQQKTKIKKINIIGLRLGAFLGSIYSNQDDEIEKLVLIEPILKPGKDLSRSLRGKLIKELCTDGEITSNRNNLLSNLNNNISVDFSGHEISSKFYKDLLKFDEINPYVESISKCKSVYMINVSQIGKITRQFQRIIKDLPVRKVFRTKIIKLEPFWGQINSPNYSILIEEIAEFSSLKDNHIQENNTQTPKLENHHRKILFNRSVSNAFCTINSNISYKESILNIKNGKDNILGILSEPISANFNAVTVIFLHGWAGYRIGPHRIITEYARRLAKLGFQCIRFDFRGKGFSRFNDDSNNITQLSDLEVVLNNLKQSEMKRKIVLVGICSGARLALCHAMKGVIGVDGIIEMSTPLLRPEKQIDVQLSKSKSILQEYFKKFCKKETWIKFFNRELKIRLIFKIIKEPIIKAFIFLFRKKKSYGIKNNKNHNDVFGNFDGKILAIHGERDPETEVALMQVTNLTRKYNIPLEKHIIKGANHSFYSIAWKNEIFDIMKNWLKHHYSNN